MSSNVNFNKVDFAIKNNSDNFQTFDEKSKIRMTTTVVDSNVYYSSVIFKVLIKKCYFLIRNRLRLPINTGRDKIMLICHYVI